MSDFNELVDMLENKNPLVPQESNASDNSVKSNLENKVVSKRSVPFDIKLFAEEIREYSEDKNAAYAQLSQTISSYDIAHNCIGMVVKKILNYPVKSFAQQWLPVILRATMGSAIHDFIQNHSRQFTEIEPSIKIPSIRFSGRIDALMGFNVINEIKSCTFEDYQKIIKTQQPRIGDFYQTVVYKYMLENHLQEAQQQQLKSKDNPNGVRTPPPKLEKYDINTLQLIYIANNVISDDSEDLGQCLDSFKKIKKLLGSKHDQFYFMTSVTLDTSKFDIKPYMNFVKEKIESINYYVTANKLPDKADKFVNPSKCFFCLYQEDCHLKK